jgi:hypothetical protein
VQQVASQITPEFLTAWNSWFARQFDDHTALPTPLGADAIEVEGHVLPVMSAGVGDGVLLTIVHVTEIELVWSGDVVYNDIHRPRWMSTKSSRVAWLEAIDVIAALRPQTIIAGNRDPRLPTTPYLCPTSPAEISKTSARQSLRAATPLNSSTG